MTCRPSLPPHAQKSVVGRLLVFQVLAPHLPMLASPRYRPADELLCSRLDLITRQVLNEADEEEPLASFLRGLVEEMRAEVGRLPARTRGILASPLQELEELVTIFCDSPYDPLKHLMGAVAQTSACFYHSYEVTVPPRLWKDTPDIKFRRAKISLSFEPNIHVGLSTRFDLKSTLSSKVIAEIAPEWLDPKTIATFPRALLHEYIAHVPQGPFKGPPRDHPEPDDGFSEGWMDYIAHLVHRSVLTRQQTACGPLADHLVPTWMGLYDEEGEHFFKSRCRTRSDDLAAASRFEGSQAARLLHATLGRLVATNALKTSYNADDLLYRLSFGINTSDISNVTRRLFAAEIRRHILRLSLSDFLVAPLRAWVSGELGLHGLVAQLTE